MRVRAAITSFSVVALALCMAVPAAAAREAGASVAAGARTSLDPQRVAQYVSSVYSDLFDRDVDPSGLQTWVGALESGTPGIAVANAITSSPEFRSKLISSAYSDYLGRGPDAGGLRFWLDRMGEGWTIEQIDAGFISSDEFWGQSGGTASGWVRSLYGTVLGRTPADAEVGWWAERVSAGVSRRQVAMGFLLSTEYLSGVVDGYYGWLLGRGLDPSGQQFWVGRLQSGGRDEEIIGGIVSSEEYWGLSARFGWQLVLQPSESSVVADEAQQYFAVVRDADGATVLWPTVDITLAVDGDPGACDGLRCTPVGAGTHQVTAQWENLGATSVLHSSAPGPTASRLFAWGQDWHAGALGTISDQPTQLGAATTWTALDVNSWTVLALRSDGSLRQWRGEVPPIGQDYPKYPIDVVGDRRWTSVGHDFGYFGSSTDAVAVADDGTLWTWDTGAPSGSLGHRSTEQVGTDHDWASADIGGYSAVGIRTDGTLWTWDLYGGPFTSVAPERVGTATWRSFSVGPGFVLAVRTDGTLWSWGRSDAGVLGTGGDHDHAAPVQVGSATNWTSVVASDGGGSNFALGTRSDGSLWAWGQNDSGQLGDGTTVGRDVPVQVGLDHRWTQAAAAGHTTAALAEDGSVWTWGLIVGPSPAAVDRTASSVPVQVSTGGGWTAVATSGSGIYALRP